MTELKKGLGTGKIVWRLRSLTTQVLFAQRCLRRAIAYAREENSSYSLVPSPGTPGFPDLGAASRGILARHIDAIYQHTLPTIAYFKTQPV
ncbi:hypothetical protein FD723_17845 [Nostoc sp. C052]|uniref:hypothetical protein n=1 Tax=Nostoc sp. C052 TaxID=2576902 RepID=UPI0015C2CEB8|nr:hypothetical protein [Nostoc sp. C052]QLE42097.1 hypothetical protein FD723_17845 [Nostoc sp. C052]